MANLINLNQNFILKEINDYFIEIYENIDEGEQESFNVVFEDLSQIQRLIYLESVTIKDIKWFFGSDLFHILSDDEEEENRVLLNEVYNLLLNYSVISESKDVYNHMHVLIEKGKTLQANESNFLEEMCQILKDVVPSALQKHLKELIDLAELEKLNKYIRKQKFFRLPNTKKLSPTALESLNNNLKKYLN